VDREVQISESSGSMVVRNSERAGLVMVVGVVRVGSSWERRSTGKKEDNGAFG